MPGFEDEAICAGAIRSCSQAQDLLSGKKIHSGILLSSVPNISSSRYLANLMLELYGRCGRPIDAACLFDQIEHPNLFSWNLLMAAYTRSGHVHEAECILRRIPSPDTVSFNTIISAYGDAGLLSQAHAMFEKLPKKNTVSWNAVITAYAHSGHLQMTRRLFNQIPSPNTTSWNIMLDAYARSGNAEEAKEVFDRMPRRNVVSWTTLISMYADEGDVHKAEEMFVKMPQRNVVSWTTMVQGYARNGHISKARELFVSMPHRNAVTWSVMLLAYAQQGYHEDAEKFFELIPSPSVVCWNALLQVRIQRSISGARVFFDKMPKRDVVSWTSMVAAYGSCGNIDEAEKLFREMPVKNTISWSTMISAYAQNNRLDKALELFFEQDHKSSSSWTSLIMATLEHKQALHLFKLMDLEGVQPDVSAYSAILTTCSLSENSSDLGRLIHSEFLQTDLEPDVALGNSLITFYSSCSCIQQAEAEFQKMKRHDLKSWTSLIMGYSRNQRAREGIKAFVMMDQAGFHPDNFAFAAAYEACGSLASSALAKLLHGAFETSRNTADIVLENVLVDLYAKCGNLYESRAAFKRIREKDLVSWSTLIAAHVQNGEPQEALELFSCMVSEGLEPDHVNFVAVLTACSHLGDLEQAWMFFVSIVSDYGLQLVTEHYHCMVDSLARAGKLKEAQELVMVMPFVPGDVTQMSLLAACRTHGKKSDQNCSIDLKNPAPYVMLSNICTSTS